MHVNYTRDIYTMERDSFEEFCIAFTKYNNESYFEYDAGKQEYYKPHIETAYQIWLHGFGFGYDKGYETTTGEHGEN